ncbi:hypothetical protein BCR44DRAFT_367473 [Catenaria anguillulae PL171]|uniref:Uncharacterized protein n=1 Tax=Catenaria anguillulae PL171 TaxID=765915 RepID=A0A1Y2HDS2_9FUNG|nr:hypothetical protein BCR44DRAFT_367473 [Catenaria anguillulae PL171]
MASCPTLPGQGQVQVQVQRQEPEPSLLYLASTRPRLQDGGLIAAQLVYNGDEVSKPIDNVAHNVPHDKVRIASVIVLPLPHILGPVPAQAAAPAGVFAMGNLPDWIRPDVEAIVAIRDGFRARAGGRRVVSLPLFLFGDDFGRRTRSFGPNYKWEMSFASLPNELRPFFAQFLATSKFLHATTIGEAI